MAPTDLRTAKHKLLDHIMVARTGSDLGHYVRAQRTDGTSWRRIATAVARLTNEELADVTLIDWFGDAEPKAEVAE